MIKFNTILLSLTKTCFKLEKLGEQFAMKVIFFSVDS